MTKHLGDYWKIGDAWDKTFRGRFQVEDGQVVFTPYSATNAPPTIAATYEVLPLRQCLGVMRVCFKHKGQKYEGVVSTSDHWSDNEAQRAEAGRLETAHLQPVG